MKAQIYKFEDGLRLVHLERKSTRAVAIGLLTGAGSENETAENNGACFSRVRRPAVRWI